MPSSRCAACAIATLLVLSACGSGSSSTSTTGTTTSSSGNSGKTTTHADKPASKGPAAAPYTPGPNARTDPDRSSQYGLDEIKLPAAWKTSGGQGVTIAVVDSGVDLGHPDLKSRLVSGHDFVKQGGSAKDQNGHGTHVSGIAAAATDNGIGVAGGAPAAKIMPVRVLDSKGQGSSSNIGKGIKWAADHGAKVINLSLGESGLAGQLLRGGSLNSDISYASHRGAVVVAAAGNDGTASKPYRTTTPVLVVGAVDDNGQPARFSNFGAQDAVTAPGVHVLSTLPTYSTELSDQHGQGYGYLDGTSMAAPYVSAVAALLMAQGRTPQQVISAIQHSAKNPSKNPKLGLGIVDAQAALQSKPSTQSSSSGPPAPPKGNAASPKHRRRHRP